MIVGSDRRTRNGIRLVGFSAAALVLAACGSSSQAGSATSAQPGSAAPSAAPTSAPASAPSSAPASSAPAASASGPTVKTQSGAMGTFLTTSSGLSLYEFVSDSSTKSTCYGPCAMYWPPLIVTGKPTGAGGVSNGKLGTITRTDGKKQVTYAGRPLYTYQPDSAPGDTTGQGSGSFGAKWWLMAPSGKPITSMAGASSPASSAPAANSGGSGGGGGWA